MAVYIALAFILVPIIEIAIFIEVGGEIGLWNTLAVVVLTAIVGTWMLRAQGMRTLRSAQDSLARQVFPVSEVFDGLCLLVGGALLLTPGFLTDALGFLLFQPVVQVQGPIPCSPPTFLRGLDQHPSFRQTLVSDWL